MSGTQKLWKSFLCLQHLQNFASFWDWHLTTEDFAQIAQPLYALTRKDVTFHWTAECEQLRITTPVLAYPNFDKDFSLETDASSGGLGAILTQDGKPHPIAYASCSLSTSEKNYLVTDMEMLAVVWGVAHFRYYLYRHKVTIYTDHAAVKAVLGTPNLTGKHARWWSKLYGNCMVVV